MSTIASLTLAVLGLIAFHQYQRGTLGTWLRAKFLNAADPLPPTATGQPGSVGSAETRHGSSWLKPVQAAAGSGFGPRTDPINGRTKMHAGIDYGAPMGTPVRASRAGTVTWAGARGGYGNMVAIDHGGGFTSRYAHLSKMDVGVGTKVPTAYRIGEVGSTGRSTAPHLHFEIRLRGEAIDPAPLLANAQTGAVS